MLDTDNKWILLKKKKKCLYPIYMNDIMKQLLILYVSWLDNDLGF